MRARIYFGILTRALYLTITVTIHQPSGTPPKCFPLLATDQSSTFYKKIFPSLVLLCSSCSWITEQLPCTEQLGENWSLRRVRSFISEELLQPCHRASVPVWHRLLCQCATCASMAPTAFFATVSHQHSVAWLLHAQCEEWDTCY